MDRQQLEQEAIAHLGRGNLEAALRAYQGILKVDARDKRVRQKVGELYLKLGRPREAETQFREVLDALQKEGNHRAAVAVAKQLQNVLPDDAGLLFEIGELYIAAGFPNDARSHLEQAMRLHLSNGRPLDAAKAARRLAELSPGELVLRMKVGELLEAGGDKVGAATTWRAVAEEYRRRGRLDEVGRIAEILLKLFPDDPDALLDAAAGRIDAGDARRALAHLQVAYARDPLDARTLDLLARAFEAASQPDKAAKVLLKLAEVAAEQRDTGAEADALRRAAILAPGDSDLQQRLAAAEERRLRLQQRVTSLPMAQPVDEEETVAVVRAEVFARYGFPDRAEATLRAALEARPDALSLLAALAELWVTRGKVEEGIRVLQGLVSRAGADTNAVRDRVAVLRGAAGPAAPETPVVRGDRLAAEGDLDGAMVAYREALAADPLDDEVLGKIAALRAAARAAPPLVDEEGTYAEISPDALEDASSPGDDLVDEARSLLAIGMFADAFALVEERTSLSAKVVAALAQKGMGEPARAVDILREATNEAADADPAYPEALFELAALYTQTGKQRSALRLLEEVLELDPGFRPQDVEARIKGLKKLVG